MNMDVGKYQIAEILAVYTDKMLRKGKKDIASSIEELIDQQVSLFSFLIDKDLYIEVYRNNLARRLLQEKSEDIEAEKQMISHLKINCGLAQIKMLEGMISDLMIAKDEIKSFEATNAFQQQTFEY